MAGAEYTRRPARDPSEAPQVVVVGAASRDVAPDDPRGWRLGGGVAYGALTLARLGVRTAALIGVDGPAERAEELELLGAAGVEMRLVRLARGPVLENLERPEGRLQMCLDPGSPVPPRTLPRAWRGAAWWLLAPIAGELDDGWAEVPGAAAHVIVAWQGLLRTLIPGRPVGRLGPFRSSLLARSELVGLSCDDVDRGLPLADLLGLLPGTAELVLTAGDAGGLVVGLAASDGRSRPGARATRRMRRYPAISARREVDATGAGDVFLAALLGVRILAAATGRRAQPGSDLRLAAAAASLTVEGVGLQGVPDSSALAACIGRPPAAPTA